LSDAVTMLLSMPTPKVSPLPLAAISTKAQARALPSSPIGTIERSS